MEMVIWTIALRNSDGDALDSFEVFTASGERLAEALAEKLTTEWTILGDGDCITVRERDAE
jgi:hypothetical protein